MPDLCVWTPQEIADEIGMSREFVVTAIKGRTAKYSLNATKKGRTWLISDADAKEFIKTFHSPVKEWYTPQDIAKAIGMTRTYVMNCITGYGGRKEPTLLSEKRGTRWCIGKEEAERFIGEHGRV
jgi:hypothetical protein